MWDEADLQGPIQSVEVSFIVHATEDLEALEDSVCAALSIVAPPEEERFEGHFGNAIVRVRYQVVGEKVRDVLESVARHTPAEAKKGFRAQVASLMDEHSALFLRFDKQRLVKGVLAEGAEDAVRVKVKPRSFALRGNVAAEYYRDALFGGERQTR